MIVFMRKEAPHMPYSGKGFTLIELITVVIIVAILAALAAPLGQEMKTRAICAEGATAMSAIRSAMMAYLATNNSDTFGYCNFLSKDPAFASALGLTLNNLNGTYFGKECYHIYCEAVPSRYRYIRCFPEPTAASIGLGDDYGPPDVPCASEGKGVVDVPGGDCYLIMYVRTGNIKQKNISRSGFPANDWNP